MYGSVRNHKQRIKMKKALVIIGSAVLVVSGCSTSPQEPAATAAPVVVVETTQPQPVATQPPARINKDDLFYDYVSLNAPRVVDMMGKSWTIDFANILCDEIDNGLTMRGLAVMLVENDLDDVAEEIGQILGAAIATYCPWNEFFIS